MFLSFHMRQRRRVTAGFAVQEAATHFLLTEIVHQIHRTDFESQCPRQQQQLHSPAENANHWVQFREMEEAESRTTDFRARTLRHGSIDGPAAAITGEAADTGQLAAAGGYRLLTTMSSPKPLEPPAADGCTCCKGLI